MSTSKLRLLNKSETLKKIAAISKSTASNRANIQDAVIGGLAHFADYGDLTLLTKLVQAVSPSNATQLRKYVKHHAPVVWNNGDGFKKVKNGGIIALGDALSVVWSDFEAASPKAKVTDTAKRFTNIIKQLDKLYIEAVESGDEATAEAIAKFALAK